MPVVDGVIVLVGVTVPKAPFVGVGVSLVLMPVGVRVGVSVALVPVGVSDGVIVVLTGVGEDVGAPETALVGLSVGDGVTLADVQVADAGSSIVNVRGTTAEYVICVPFMIGLINMTMVCAPGEISPPAAEIFEKSSEPVN